MTINISKCFCLCDFSFILVILCLTIGCDLVAVTQPKRVISLGGYTSKLHGVPAGWRFNSGMYLVGIQSTIPLWHYMCLQKIAPFFTWNLTTISGCRFRSRTQIFYSNTAFLNSNFCGQILYFILILNILKNLYEKFTDTLISHAIQLPYNVITNEQSWK